MSKEHTDTAFYKFDVDESPDIAQELSIKAMPTFVFFKNGEEVKKVIGTDKKKLEDAIVQLNA
jgi:thioredoxin 1